jgi:hypothetical protein
MKGMTKWYPRSIDPIRCGEYECAIKFTRTMPLMSWRLMWDGDGFLVPFPMVVYQWRGVTRKQWISGVAP